MDNITYIVYRSLDNNNGISIKCSHVKVIEETGQTIFYTDNSGSPKSIKAIAPKECLIIKRD